MRNLCQYLVIVTCSLVLAGCGGNDKKPTTELVMFCAAGIKNPVTRIAKQYEQETGVKVRLQFAGSGTLLSNLQIAPGDIYLAADNDYIEKAREKGLVDEAFLVAFMKAGLGVPKGNPKAITSIQQLTEAKNRVGIGNPDAASIGKFTKKVLSKHGVWDSLNPTVTFPTVNELANAIKLNSIDVVVLWDAVAAQYPEIDFVSVPEFDAETKSVTVAITTACKQQKAARDFCLYLSSATKGQPVFKEEGFQVPSKSAGVSRETWRGLSARFLAATTSSMKLHSLALAATGVASRKGSPHPLRSHGRSLLPSSETRHYISPVSFSGAFSVDCTVYSPALYSVQSEKIKNPTASNG